MTSKALGLVAFVTIMIASMEAIPASAEMQILESNMPHFQVGTRIADSDDLQLPPGGQVKVLILPANETKVFKGPSAVQRSLRDIPVGGSRGPAAPVPPRN